MFPLWFFPTRFIVKELDQSRPGAFYKEGRLYTQLQHLQGNTIAIHYGTALVRHSGETEVREAHLFEVIDGKFLHEYTEEEAIQLRIREEMDTAFRLFSEMHIAHGDVWPRHIIHTKKGLRIIDFGNAEETDEADQLNRGCVENGWAWFCWQSANVSEE